MKDGFRNKKKQAKRQAASRLLLTCMEVPVIYKTRVKSLIQKLLTHNRICVVGKKETIYPLVQTVNALYLQLLEMQKAFTKRCEHQALHNLPTSDEIKKLQTDYNNMLTAIIDLLDGAKYLWEGEHHETK